MPRPAADTQVATVIWQPASARCMSELFEAAVGVVAIIVIILVSYMAVASVHGTYNCEDLEGYNPHGATNDDKYPPGTWAGTCKDARDREMIVPSLILLVAPAGVVMAFACRLARL